MRSALPAILAALSISPLFLTPIPAAAVPGIGIPDCQGRPLVKPSTYVVACGDGGIVASHLTWPVWRSTYAQGTGKAAVNDCTPNCASGHEISYGVRIVAQGILNCPAWRLYKSVTLTYTGSPVDSRPQSETLTSRCR